MKNSLQNNNAILQNEATIANTNPAGKIVSSTQEEVWNLLINGGMEYHKQNVDYLLSVPAEELGALISSVQEWLFQNPNFIPVYRPVLDKHQSLLLQEQQRLLQEREQINKEQEQLDAEAKIKALLDNIINISNKTYSK